MKKTIIATSIVLSLLGIATFAQAASPVVNAGADQTITLPASTVTLTGTAVASSPATITSATWALSSGPSGATVSISPNALVASVSGLTVAGNYVFTLTALDSTSLTSTSTTTITVNPAITNPVVNAGTAQTLTLPTSATNLSGSAQVASGRTITSYSWVQTSGPVASTISSPTSANTAISGLSTAGVYVYTLTVTDSTGSTGSAVMNVTVNSRQGTSTVSNKRNMKLEINESGKAEVRGVIESINGSVITLKVWGITVTLNTTGGKFTGRVNDLSLFKVGDTVNAQGSVDTTASNITINARNVNDLSVKTLKEHKKRLEDKKSDDNKKFSQSNGFKGNGRGEREDH